MTLCRYWSGTRRPGKATQRAGLSVRGFVEITVALEQQMLLASTGARPEPMPVEETYPITMDSGYYTLVQPPVQPESIIPMSVAPAPVPYTPVPYWVPPRDASGDTLGAPPASPDSVLRAELAPA